ncbi:hypothetical protein I4F81_007577 [Pyropia yezoensis]|uniref:Uncharacterized protein n=1 Tax=Pyropia yezoensis TaxID=2788 RepID=A0ACC3C4F4_PYRYE|nr:hypothetical protein I4F81_007577 [Neopyropia yezoensis]
MEFQGDKGHEGSRESVRRATSTPSLVGAGGVPGTRDADAQQLDSLVADTCTTFFLGGPSPPAASLLVAVERATAVALRLIAPRKDVPVDPVVASATVLKLRALVWPAADRPDVMNIFSRALCTALHSDGGASALTLPANVVASLLSAMVLPVTHPDSWATGAQLSVLTVCAATTTATKSGLLTGTRGQRVDQQPGLPLLPRASGAGDQERQPLPTAPCIVGESVVEAVCLLLLSGLRNGALVKDYVRAGDILRFLSLTWYWGCWSSAATDALAAFLAEDASRVTDLIVARTGDSVGDSRLPHSRNGLCTDVWREVGQAMSKSMLGAQEQAARGSAARALAMVPSMHMMLSLPGVLACAPTVTHTEIPGFGSWSAAVTAYVSELLRGVTVVVNAALCNPSPEGNDEAATRLLAAVYTLTCTGLGLLLSADKSLRKDTWRLLCLLTRWCDAEASSSIDMDIVQENSNKADDERRSWSPDVLLRLCKSVVRMSAADKATVQGDQDVLIFALALDAALRLVHVAAARDVPLEEPTPLQSLAVCTAFVRSCDAFVAALPMGDAAILPSAGSRDARARLAAILARLLDEGRGRVRARTPASVIGNLRRLVLSCVRFLASEAWERPDYRAFKRPVADAWFESLPWVWCLAFGDPGSVAREVATAAELYWTAVGRRGRRETPNTLSVSRTTMAITTSRLLQTHDRGQLLAGGAALLNVLTNVQRTLFYGKISRDLRELSSAVDEIIGTVEGGPGARHRDRSGPAAARHVREHACEPVRVRTSGSGTMEDPIEIIDDDEEEGLVALPQESSSVATVHVRGLDAAQGPTAHPVRGGTVPVAGVQPLGAVGGGGSCTPQELTDVGDLPELPGHLAQRRAMGVCALVNSTSPWIPASVIHLDDGEDRDVATGSAAEWRCRVLRLVTAKANLTVSTVADEVYRENGSDRRRPDHPVSVHAPTAQLRAHYGSSLVVAATHTEAEQAETVDKLILVEEHPLQTRADDLTDDDGDDNDRRLRQPTYAANASPGDLCNIWVPVPDTDDGGNKDGKGSRCTYSTAIDAVCVCREAVTTSTTLQGRDAGTRNSTPLWLSVRRTDADLVSCATRMAGLVVVTLSMSIVSDWREYSGLGEWMRLPRAVRESLEPPAPTEASSVIVPGTSSPVMPEPWPNAQPPPPPPLWTYRSSWTSPSWESCGLSRMLLAGPVSAVYS